MKLSSPFSISSRLSPAIQISKGFTLSFDCEKRKFVLDLPDHYEYWLDDFRFPEGRIAGDTNEDVLQKGFSAVLSFMSACAESRRYATRNGKSAMEGENSGLFPDNVGELCEQFSDEIGMLAFEIEETKGLISR